MNAVEYRAIMLILKDIKTTLEEKRNLFLEFNRFYRFGAQTETIDQAFQDVLKAMKEFEKELREE